VVKHTYIPIVKGKQYDLRALGQLQTENRILIKPLIELPPTPPNLGVDEYLNKFIQDLIKYGGEGRLFVDFYGFLPGESIKNGTLATIAGYESLLKIAQQQVTPVYGFGRDDMLWEQLGQVVKLHDQGVCFRLEEDDLEEDAAEETWENILTRSEQLGCSLKNIDILIDLGDVRLKSINEKVNLITDFWLLKPKGIMFRSFAIAGSSVPKDVSVIPEDSTGKIERKELLIWANLKTDVVDGDNFIYSDYGVVHPDFAAHNLPVGGSANCKIRYTAGNNIIIFRGHKRAGDTGQPHVLANKVRSNPIYCGRDFSFGDQYIDDVADHKKGPGNLGNWVQADMNHHLVYTSIQIESLRKKVLPGMTQEEIDLLLEEFV
jgi:T4 beta protein